MIAARTIAVWAILGSGSLLLGGGAWLILVLFDRAFGPFGQTTRFFLGVGLIVALAGIALLAHWIWERKVLLPRYRKWRLENVAGEKLPEPPGDSVPEPKPAPRPRKPEIREKKPGFPGDIPALAHAAPAGAHFASGDSEEFVPERHPVPDRPIKVVLSRASDGRALLTFETCDPTLAGTGHTWSLGGESGWFELERAGDRWIAEARLDMSASNARAIIHRLVVQPVSEADAKTAPASQPANVIPVSFRLARSHSEEEFASRFPMAAAASPAETPVVHEKVRKLPLTDPESGLSIEALLQPAPDEKTTLVVRSENRALAGAGVAYSVGPSSGTMRFGPKRDECYYLARTTLPLSWSEAQTAPVDLEILLKPETSTPE